MVDPEEAARIQLLFRHVNDRIHTVGADLFGIPPDEPLAVVCECADLGCVERIQVPAQDLRRARSSPGRFVLVPGHAGPDAVIVEEHPGYVIVAVDEALLERARGRDGRGGD